MKVNKRAVALLCSLVVLLTAAVGATVAYLVDKSDKVENTFTPSHVACAVKQDTEGNYIVENTGDTTAYIRVAVVATWVKTDGTSTVVSAVKPTIVVEFEENNWIEGSDTFLYYSKAVPADGNDATSAITVECTSDAPGEGYELSIEVVSSAIQATTDAVDDWSSAVTATTDGADLTPET